MPEAKENVLDKNIVQAKDDFATTISTDIENLQGNILKDLDVSGLLEGKGLQGIDGKTIIGGAMSNMLMGGSHNDIHDQVVDYLTHDNVGDRIYDTLFLGKKIDIALQQFGEEGKKLAASIHGAQDKFDRVGTQADLDALKKELHLDNEDVTVEEKDFYQDDDASDISQFNNKIDISDKQQVLFSSIKSEPLEWNKTTGVTRCSLTAKKNIKKFGIDVPNGNAFDAKDKTPTDSHYKTSIEKSQGQQLSPADMAGIDEKINIADVFVYSQGKYAKFGHRCAMFKNMTDKEWYVLDPYRQPDAGSKAGVNPESVKPKSLEEYTKNNNIAKINFYESPYAVVNAYDADAVI